MYGVNPNHLLNVENKVSRKPLAYSCEIVFKCEVEELSRKLLKEQQAKLQDDQNEQYAFDNAKGVTGKTALINASYLNASRKNF